MWWEGWGFFVKKSNVKGIVCEERIENGGGGGFVQKSHLKGEGGGRGLFVKKSRGGGGGGGIQNGLPLQFRCNSYRFRPQIPLLCWLGQKLRSLSDFPFPTF